MVCVIGNKEKDRATEGVRKRGGGRKETIIFQGGQKEGEGNCHIFAVIGERELLLIGVAMAMVGT